MKQFYVYILANKKNGTLYIGITSDLVKRTWEHKQSITGGFTEKYDVKTLVYYETHDNAEQAILREKKLKKWPRQWKINIIQDKNPDWKDLYADIVQ